MRTQTEIRDQIRAAFMANVTLQTLYGLSPNTAFTDQFSAVSLEAALIDVATFITYSFEFVFEAHKTEVSDIIANQNPHTLRWYRNKALQFRYGQALLTDTDGYDDTGLLPSQISASQIVKHAAAIEVSDNTGVPIVRIKAATANGTDLQPLGATEKTALVAYLQEIKDAGVKIQVTSAQPDNYRATLEVFYNPLVLNSTGGLLTNTGIKPVEVAVKKYLQGLPFNGEFSVMALTDALQRAEGVVIVQVQSSEFKYANLPYQPTGSRYTPDAGYMRVYQPGDLTINYIAYAASY